MTSSPPTELSSLSDIPGVDVLLLDGRRLPVDLVDVLRKCRARVPRVVVLILADEGTDLRLCLKEGASDFVLSPWATSEISVRLLARMELPQNLVLGPCVIDLRGAQAIWSSHATSLTPTEVRILEYLVRRIDAPVSREDLLLAVWGYQVVVDTRAVALAMSRLRRKIEQDPDQPRYLLTVYGVGYRLVLTPAVQEGTLPRILPFGLPGVGASWVGREKLLDEIIRRSSQGCRAQVLHGPGGIGKTRLVVEAGRYLARSREIRFIDVSDMLNLSSLLHTLGRGVQATQQGGEVGLAEICHALSGRQVLLILDGVERLIDSMATLVGVLSRLEGVELLITSRIHLGLPAVEHLYIPPLSIAAGAELFVQRAQGIQPELQFNDDDHNIIERIVKGIDGIPLAIELAASRVQLFSLAEICSRLDVSLDLLGNPGVPHTRHQSLHHILDDSWILLTPSLQRVLITCATFRGGFSLESAEQVLPEMGASIADALQNLLNHSLIHSQPCAGGPRISIFESVRHYLEGKEGMEVARRRHLNHFRVVCRQLAQDVHGPDLMAVRSRFRLEQLNLMAALNFALTVDAVVAAEMILDLCQLYWPLGEPGALQLMGMVDEGLPAPVGIRLQVQRARYLLRAAAYGESRRLCIEILEACQTVDQLGARSSALQLLSALDAAEGHFAAVLERSPVILNLLETQGQRRLKGVHLIELSATYRRMGHIKQAMLFQEQALEIALQEGALWNEMLFRHHMGLLYLQVGDLVAAENSMLPQLGFYREAGDTLSELMALLNLAICYVDWPRVEDARRILREAAALVARVGEGAQRHYFACIQARLALHEGDLIEAGRHLDTLLHADTSQRSHYINHAWALEMWRHHLAGRVEEALAKLEVALSLYTSNGNELEVGRLLVRRAVLVAERGSAADVPEIWERALTVLLPSELEAVHLLIRVSWIHLWQMGIMVVVPDYLQLDFDMDGLRQLERDTHFCDVRWAIRAALRHLGTPHDTALIQQVGAPRG